MAGASKPASLKGMADRPSAAADFCNKIGTFRTWRDVRVESVMRSKADIGRAARGPVARSNLAGAMSLVQRAAARATGSGPGDWPSKEASSDQSAGEWAAAHKARPL
jgi:hypothetical protein